MIQARVLILTIGVAMAGCSQSLHCSQKYLISTKNMMAACDSYFYYKGEVVGRNCQFLAVEGQSVHTMNLEPISVFHNPTIALEDVCHQ